MEEENDDVLELSEGESGEGKQSTSLVSAGNNSTVNEVDNDSSESSVEMIEDGGD